MRMELCLNDWSDEQDGIFYGRYLECLCQPKKGWKLSEKGLDK